MYYIRWWLIKTSKFISQGESYTYKNVFCDEPNTPILTKYSWGSAGVIGAALDAQNITWKDMLEITGLYASLLAFIYIKLSLNVISLRRSS